MEKKKKKIKPRSAKNKGMSLQKDICRTLSMISKIPWGEDELIASRPMGQSGVDIILMGKAAELFPFSIEAKNQETWDVFATLKQAIVNKKENTFWCVVYSKNYAENIIIFDKWDFKKILSLKTRKRYFDHAQNYEHLQNISLQKWFYKERMPKRNVLLFQKENNYFVALWFKQFVLSYKAELKAQGKI